MMSLSDAEIKEALGRLGRRCREEAAAELERVDAAIARGDVAAGEAARDRAATWLRRSRGTVGELRLSASQDLRDGVFTMGLGNLPAQCRKAGLLVLDE